MVQLSDAPAITEVAADADRKLVATLKELETDGAPSMPELSDAGGTILRVTGSSSGVVGESHRAIECPSNECDPGQVCGLRQTGGRRRCPLA